MSGEVERSVGMHRVGPAASAVTALKLAGASFAEIADTLGIASTAEAQSLYFQDLGSRVTDEDRNMERTEAKARLERLLRSTWRKATTERDPEHLDAPTEVIVHAPTVAEIDAWVAHVASNDLSGLPSEADIIDAEIADDDGR